MKSFLKRPDCRRYICKSSLEKLCWAIAPKLCNSSEIFWLPMELIFARLLACKKVSRWDVYKQKCYSKKQLAIRDFPEHYTRIARQWRWCAMILILAILCGIVVVLVKNFSTQSSRRQLFFFFFSNLFSRWCLLKQKQKIKINWGLSRPCNFISSLLRHSRLF